MIPGDGRRRARQENDADGLLLEIARCPVVRLCLEQPTLDHPCAAIVRAQGVSSLAEFHLPEPWTGPIGTAPILFVSSNPSISRSAPPSDFDEESPTGDSQEWPDARVVDFFNGRFGAGGEERTRDGLYVRRRNGSFGDWVRFWASAKARATEALGRPAIPGHDYAMTEVVRCKSRGEAGVVAAAGHCPDRYLERTIAVAAAGLLICFGKFAQDELRRRYDLPAERVLAGPVEIAGKDRYVVSLPHPNRPLPSTHPLKKKLVDALSGEELATVRTVLARGC